MMNAEFYQLMVLSPIFPVISTEERSCWMSFDVPVISMDARNRPIHGIIVSSRRTEVFDCPAHSRHVSHSYYSDVELDLVGGTVLHPFVYAEDVALVNAQLANALSHSGLTGVRVQRARVVHQQTPANNPEVYYLQITASCFYSLPPINPAFSNRCPFCGDGPLVCDTCGCLNFRCPTCGESSMISSASHGGRKDRHLIAEEAYGLTRRTGGPRLDLRRYPGTDFCGDPFPVITRKALDFFRDFGAVPFAVQPLGNL